MGNTPSINLIKGKEQSVTDKIIQWALTIGRVLVIVTETIALAAFLYRFSLDRELIDLHDQIAQKAKFVSFSKQNEDKFRNLQERLTTASELDGTSKQTANTFSEIVNLAAKDLIFNNITLSQDFIRADITARSIGPVTTFVEELKKYPNVNFVSIDKIDNKTSSSRIIVSITAKLGSKPYGKQ